MLYWIRDDNESFLCLWKQKIINIDFHVKFELRGTLTVEKFWNLEYNAHPIFGNILFEKKPHYNRRNTAFGPKLEIHETNHISFWNSCKSTSIVPLKKFLYV